VVRQTETAAIRKAEKNARMSGSTSGSGSASKKAARPAGSTVTFSRAVAGIFTPGVFSVHDAVLLQFLNIPNYGQTHTLGTLVDEFDPAFQDLLQSTSSQHSSDAVEDGGGSDVDAGEDVEEGAPAVDGTGRLTREDVNTERSDAWIAAIYEDDVRPGSASRDQGSGAERVIISVVAVSVQAHRVQCRIFRGDSAVEAVDDFLTLLMVSYDGSKPAILWLRLLLDSWLHF
jgi:hypothetical protein